jgi:hypothetical protein
MKLMKDERSMKEVQKCIIGMMLKHEEKDLLKAILEQPGSSN